MRHLAALVTMFVDRLAVDRTALDGRYNST